MTLALAGTVPLIAVGTGFVAYGVALPLDAVGRVAWWPADRAEVTLNQILIHMIAETHRHAGHADIVREFIDGSVGFREENDNMAPVDEAWWASYRERLQVVASEFADNR